MKLEAIEVGMQVRLRSYFRPGVHNGQTGIVTSLGVFSETVLVRFTDGVETRYFAYELEEVNDDRPNRLRNSDQI